MDFRKQTTAINWMKIIVQGGETHLLHFFLTMDRDYLEIFWAVMLFFSAILDPHN